MSVAAALDGVARRLGPLARRRVPLGPMTTYRVGGDAALFVRVDAPGDMPEVVEALCVRDGGGGDRVGDGGGHRGGDHRGVDIGGGNGSDSGDLEVLVVGRGSNLLVADEGFVGVAIVLGEGFARIEFPDESVADGVADRRADEVGATVIVSAGGATTLPVLARRTAALGLTGLEWAVGVPGSVGGAVRMNAGGHGSDIAASLIDAEILDLSTGETRRWPAESIGLRFRGSILTDRHLVVSARFAVQRGERQRCEAELTEIVRWRREHQPGGQNAGSVFVNPIPGQLAAAQLIDALGLRGLRIGTAEVSTKHANFIQADENGRAADVHAVMEHVRAAVRVAHGIELRSEVRLVGFPAAATSRVGVQ